MATLEVHDLQGRVQFIALSRDHPVLFGTSAACDVVLAGEGIRPVHGRIRWKSRRFKVEASPDAEYLVINGQKMTSASLHQGDEISVGPCRIFLQKLGADIGSGPNVGGQPVDEPATVVSQPAQKSTRGQDGDSKRRARGREGRRGERRSMAERDDLFDALGLDELADAATGMPLPSGSPRSQARDRPRSGFGRLLDAVIERVAPSKGPQAPGREQILTSPLVLGLVAALLLLIGMGFWLKGIIAATVATRVFSNAVQNFEDGDYRTAIRDFSAFLEDNPEDARCGKARVLRAFANVRQYVSPSGGTWSSALEAAREMMEAVGNEEAFRDERVDLAELVIRIGEGLADRARQAADPKALAEAESVVPMHAQIAGEPAPSFLNRSRLPSKLDQARAAVKKARVRADTLATMDRALAAADPAAASAAATQSGADPQAARPPQESEASKTSPPRAEGQKGDPATLVYAARDALIDQYPDLAHDPALIQRMSAANELIRRAVRIDTTTRAAASTPRPDPLGPPTSLVIRSALGKPADPPSPEAIVYAIADGLAYALDGSTGAPIWHVPVGQAAPFVPKRISGDNTVLVVDSRWNDLLRLDSMTGGLKWRFELGQPVLDPPLVLGNQLIQVLPSGQVLVLDLQSGELTATVNIGRPLGHAPATDDAGRLFLAGRRDCLFVLTRDPLSCAAVEYLGQLDGAIPCAPARIGPYLVIPENDGLSGGRWHIILIGSDAARIRPVQDVEIAGWTWQTPASSSSMIWAIGDKGGYEVFAVGEETSKVPFHPVARRVADAIDSGPAYALARSERELWLASGRSGKLILDPERGSIEARTNLPQPGPALAPIQLSGGHVVMTFQDQETGGVAVWGIDSASGAVAWKTILAAAWPNSLAIAAGANALSAFGTDGHELSISADQLDHGGFVTERLTTPGQFALPPGSRLSVEVDGHARSVVVPADRSRGIWIEDPSARDGWRKVELPTPLAASPLILANGILTPGLDARAYLIDPVTAQSLAEPFVPPFDRDRQGTWKSPALLDLDSVVLADDMGRVTKVALKKTPIAQLAAQAAVVLDQPIVADPTTTGAAVIVVTADRKVRALAARDLSPLGAWPLAASLSGRIQETRDGCFVMDRAGGVMAFGRDGQRAWSIKLSAEVVGTPLLADHTVLLLTADGILHIRDRADGSAVRQEPLGALPAEGSLQLGHKTLVATARGTIRPLTLAPTKPSDLKNP